ncbi:OLC1v1002074C1 [Oldenlandia corymbosa var. corymbosa]|uniref:OLC1v1002074C1 n=1 Tax=Oldenlandia corymbosa var. corymbosa TaxID=529605 RepID=A0AAV1D7H1_OLDCO|nr:OLC1v1002074C1 [Oldenlandia corymbosa var. corymbosa]
MAITYNPSTSKYSVTYDRKTIETTLTTKAAVTDEWVREVLSIYGNNPMVVGLDIEWKPNRVRYMSNKSATLQLCIDNKCLILQLFYMDFIPQSLKYFLANSNFTYVGIEVDSDIAKLRNEYDLHCAKSADIRDLAKIQWPGRFRRPGLKDLAMEVVGLYMPKPKHISMSNWQERFLTEPQIEYACIDAYASFKIGHKLILEK